MFNCKVLLGPLSFDRIYDAGELVCLSNKDAEQLAGYGLVEVLDEVKPKFARAEPVTEPEAPVTTVTEPVAEVEVPGSVTEPVAEVEAPVTTRRKK